MLENRTAPPYTGLFAPSEAGASNPSTLRAAQNTQSPREDTPTVLSRCWSTHIPATTLIILLNPTSQFPRLLSCPPVRFDLLERLALGFRYQEIGEQPCTDADQRV